MDSARGVMGDGVDMLRRSAAIEERMKRKGDKQ